MKLEHGFDLVPVSMVGMVNARFGGDSNLGVDWGLVAGNLDPNWGGRFSGVPKS